MQLTASQRLKTALSEAKAADRRLQKLICEFFPIGDRVRWMHGSSIRSGLVTDVSGNRADMLRFCIKSDVSERLCWVGAGRLLSFIGL